MPWWWWWWYVLLSFNKLQTSQKKIIIIIKKIPGQWTIHKDAVKRFQRKQMSFVQIIVAFKLRPANMSQ